MTKYYDEKCLLCERCFYHAFGNYPDGRPYEACRFFGYILHPEKGISEEDCTGFITPEDKRKRDELYTRRFK